VSEKALLTTCPSFWKTLQLRPLFRLSNVVSKSAHISERKPFRTVDLTASQDFVAEIMSLSFTGSQRGGKGSALRSKVRKVEV
jgi:hypothetical protein